MKKIPFILSIILNVVLIVALVGFHRVSRKPAFRAVADATVAEVRLQEHILTELESGEQARVEKVKKMLRRNVENGKKVATDWKNAANR